PDSSEVQSSFDRKNVSSLLGSGMELRTTSERNRTNRENSSRRPSRTLAASSGPKSQKNRNGVLAPNSSPMKSNGGEGAKSRTASATRIFPASVRLVIRSPKARFPI